MLLHLTAQATAAGSTSIRESSRAIAEATRCSRRNVQLALDGLTTRGTIATRAGTAVKAAAYAIRFLEVTPIGGAVTTPPPRAGGAAKVALNQRQGGAVTTPPPQPGLWENTHARDDRFDGFDVVRSTVIDRLLNATPTQFQPDETASARKWLHGYMCKFGEPDSHAPDPKIVAQFLACGLDVGGWPRLEALIYELMQERQKPYKYAWFVSVALQRIHGIEPAELKHRRAQLRVVSSSSATTQARSEVDEIHAGIQALAASKGMR